MARDYYEILGVDRNATETDIKRAYRRLAMEYHPDRNDGDPAAEERFKEVTEAYEILRDPDKRARFDRFGESGLRGGAGFGAGMHPDLAEALSIFMRDFGNLGGFDAFFGGGQRERRSVRRGHDVRMSLTISLAEVATGTTRTVKLRTLEQCGACDGTGAEHGSSRETCGTCGGVGEVRRATQSILGRLVSVTVCPACLGEGSVVRDPCRECRGDGRVRGEKTVKIEIPAGVAEHNYLTLRGQGQAGPRGGAPGDLIVVLEIEEDPRFERHGRDLVYDLPVSFSQAALGHEFKVPTPTDEVTLIVDAGTQSGAVLSLRGQALPDLETGRKGDLHVRIRVWTPQRVDGELAELFERLRGLEGDPPSEKKGFWNRVKEAFGS